MKRTNKEMGRIAAEAIQNDAQGPWFGLLCEIRQRDGLTTEEPQASRFWLYLANVMKAIEKGEQYPARVGPEPMGDAEMEAYRYERRRAIEQARRMESDKAIARTADPVDVLIAWAEPKPDARKEQAERYVAYLNTLPLVSALWWFIENVTPDSSYRTEVFFHLRERVRAEVQS
jgi:hypothetical protein